MKNALSPHHAEQLARFKIPAELLRDAAVRSVTDFEAREALGLNGQYSGKDLSGILFPYNSPIDGRRVSARIRLDYPLDGDSGKYLSEQASKHFFFPPAHKKDLTDAKVPVVVVEAEKSALAVTALSLRTGIKMIAFAIGGCWGWRRKTGKRLLADGGSKDETGPGPDFEIVTWRDREVYIAFDSNAESNPDVEIARNALARELASRGAKVRLVKIPNQLGVNGPDDLIAVSDDATVGRCFLDAREFSLNQLASLSTAELLAAQDAKIEWLAYPFAAPGLSSVLDALPKLGKTRFFLEAIKASRDKRLFLGHATQPMRVVFVSEQSAASLGMQVREVGFDGSEPVEELRWITREHWSRFMYTEFLAELEKQYFATSEYNCLILDTWHTIARLENENDAAEVNRLGNLTLDLATRQKIALSLSRHDRKSGGDVGLSGRSSIQLSGLVDVILHLRRLPGQSGPNLRTLELLGRVPGLPDSQVVELLSGSYVNHGYVEGGIETKLAAEAILRKAPTAKDAALSITQILEGTGIAFGQPVRDAIKRLVRDDELNQRIVRNGKKQTTVYWSEFCSREK